MSSVDPGIVAILEMLPSKHRRYLEQQYADHLPTHGNRLAKLEALAVLIGPQDINQYERLYLSGNGLSFVWFFVPDARKSLAQVAKRLSQKYGEALTASGLEPDLQLDDDPKLHKMAVRPGRIELQFGLRENDRAIFRGWRYHNVESDHVYTVVLKSEPFTLEVRAPFPKVQEGLMRAIAADIEDIDFGLAVHCGLTTDALREQLEKELPSELFGKWDVGTGRGLGSSRMYSDDDTPLRNQQDFIDQSSHDYRRLTHLDYRFDVVHQDGYVERAEYGVNLNTGDMRVGPRTSEIALEHLRKNVIRIVGAS